MKQKYLFSLLLLGLIAVSFFVGVKDMSLFQLLHAGQQERFLFFTTRLPRTLSLVLAGATLSMCGLVMQQLTQNKFVSPTTAGTMDAARLGMVFVLLFFPQAHVLTKVSIAFCFAFLGTLVFFLLTRFLPGKNPLMLPLVGVMFGNILGSGATFLAYEHNLIQNMSSWLQGNFATVMKGSYELIYVVIPVFFFVYFFAYRFTVVSLGEDVATSLGLNYRTTQMIGMGCVALSSAIILLMVGNIPFLGIIIPNFISLKYGDQLKNTLGLTALLGSIFLLVCDLLARLLIAPYEIPVSVIVGILGSLFFLYLLWQQRRVTC